MKFAVHSLLAVCATLIELASGQGSTFSPTRPPAIPLAVKSPYLNTLQFAGSDGGNGGYLAGQWAQFWQGQIAAWTGLIKVDGTTYTWMGNPGGQLVTQTAFEYTSTRSIFIMNVGGKVEMNITFLSTVMPKDLKRQSLVFSYLDVAVQSIDGAAHDVQLYTDISAEWVSGDRSTVAQWDYDTTPDGIAYHRVYRQNQLLFSEISDQAEWGNWYWSTKNVTGLTFQSGQDIVVRGSFTNNGALSNTKDMNYRPIRENWPVFGFAVNLGAVTGSVNTLYTLGLTQEMAIQFLGQTKTVVPINSLWTSYFSSETDALSFFYNDYSIASSSSTALDNKIADDSLAAGGQDYLTITSLSTRQALGATQLVGNCTKQYLFVKEISSDGNVLTVDVIFPFHPFLLYLEPSLIKLMIDPLFENQENGNYPNKWSIHDLGSHYPNATGHTDGRDEPMPLEECGNMLIMTLAYAQRTGDNAYLSQHYKILDQWTSFLVDEALIPADQISTDDFAGSLANQTNLALKGIIGIEAMSQIANLAGNDADSTKYTNIAQDYITKWQSLGIAYEASPPHTTLSYGNNGTHGLLYNLYADKLLNLNLVPQSVYDMQSAFYPTVKENYGLALDTRAQCTKSDWEMHVAAIASPDARQMLISDLARWIGETPTNQAFTDLYDVKTGDWAAGIGHFASRPVVGGHFALLALQNQCAPGQG